MKNHPPSAERAGCGPEKKKHERDGSKQKKERKQGRRRSKGMGHSGIATQREQDKEEQGGQQKAGARLSGPGTVGKGRAAGYSSFRSFLIASILASSSASTFS